MNCFAVSSFSEKTAVGLVILLSYSIELIFMCANLVGTCFYDLVFVDY